MLSSTRNRAAALGLLFWLAVLGAVVFISRHSGAASSSSTPPVEQLVEYFANPPLRLPARSPGSRLERGDPVFLQTVDGWRQGGYLGRRDSETETIQLVWYDDQIDPRRCRLEFHHNAGRFDDVVQTLLPEEKRQRIKQRLSAAFRDHGQDITAAFRPVVEKSLRQSAPLLEDALKESIERHEDEFKAIGRRWEQEIFKARIVPVLRAEVLPIVREHGEPVAQEIGRELWDRASLWRFGWRALYDKSPLPEKDLLKEEWQRFVEGEAIPVFEAHMDDILEAQKKIFVDVSENERIRDEFEAVFKEMASDPEFQRLIKAVVREAVIDNRQLHAVWTANFKSDQARAAMELAGKRLEPIVREIGDDLFGTKQTGIDPDFARVLRNQILGKDKRWVIATPLAGPTGQEPPRSESPEPRKELPLTIHPASEPARFPLLIMAAEQHSEPAP